MLETIKDALWQQFGASLQMIENAINLWPETLWDTDKKFFYTVYHTLILTDYYLTIPSPSEFVSTLPFTFMDKEDIPTGVLGDMVPDRIYTKSETIDYLQDITAKCHSAIHNLTDQLISERWIEEGGEMDYSVLEILIYNMRHVQHHAGQVNMLLRQTTNRSSGWVFRAEEE
ncbi:DinB family protein [Dyadobacter luteus]|jgi:hypothetical protein|uniref:DinB family protein n=1 Tax=Dyadobacter luteus TaxID=2259619 RepID=A0A3D8Y8J5_9BACT|nr:DinB family protein [Dyadobacter luteus]REA59529.1 DinB family protein [Dyadobacter luteus]